MKQLGVPMVRPLLTQESVRDTINTTQSYVFLERNGIVGNLGHSYHAYFVSYPREESIYESLLGVLRGIFIPF